MAPTDPAEMLAELSRLDLSALSPYARGAMQSRRWYYEQCAAGKCVKCGEPASDDRVYCEACRLARLRGRLGYRMQPVWWNDHSAWCCCFACVIERLEDRRKP